MAYSIDQTHRADLECWVESANQTGAEFPIQNLPFCTFQRKGNAGSRVGVGIGNQLIDLFQCAKVGLLPAGLDGSAAESDLKKIMDLPLDARRELRHWLSAGLSNRESGLSQHREQILVPQSNVSFLLPCSIGDYTDFYASIYHATNVGCMMRPDNPLLPNYKHVPIGYHGRSSSLVVSGGFIRRPVGQLPPVEGTSQPGYGPCRNLDYELEVGAFIGRGNPLGESIGIAVADEHLFGMVLLNDWSARDIQRWEYQPLGPFLAKNFATTISPFVVTMEALAPFRSSAFNRAAGDPVPLPYLLDENNQRLGNLDLTLTVELQTAKMREQQVKPIEISRSSFLNMYWTFAQLVTHHASNGCNLRTGDLLGSGTVSGPDRNSRGCLLELTWEGDAAHPVPGSQRAPLKLPTGEERTFLLDGDTVVFRGCCLRDGFRSIGFGDCQGTIAPTS